MAYNMDFITTYQPRHLSEECSCENINPSVEEIYDALQTGSFPLLNGEAILDDELKGKLVVKLHRSSIAFAAFSHL